MPVFVYMLPVTLMSVYCSDTPLAGVEIQSVYLCLCLIFVLWALLLLVGSIVSFQHGYCSPAQILEGASSIAGMCLCSSACSPSLGEISNIAGYRLFMLASRTLRLSMSWIICVLPFPLVGRLDWLEGVWVSRECPVKPQAHRLAHGRPGCTGA